MNQITDKVKFDDKNDTKEDICFLGNYNGDLIKYSISQKKIIKNYEKLLTKHDFLYCNIYVTSITALYNYKYLLCCNYGASCVLFEIRSGKAVNQFDFINVRLATLSSDCKFLFTSHYESEQRKNCYQAKICMKTRKTISTEKLNDLYASSMKCSACNQFLFVGYNYGHFQIIKIDNFKEIYAQKEVLFGTIESIVVSQFENKSYMADAYGNIKIITWKNDSKDANDFDLQQKMKHVTDENGAKCLLLTRDETQLLMGSYKSFYIFDPKTLQRIKKYTVEGQFVRDISYIKNAQKVLMTMQCGQLYIFNLENKELSLIDKIATNEVKKKVITEDNWFEEFVRAIEDEENGVEEVKVNRHISTSLII